MQQLLTRPVSPDASGFYDVSGYAIHLGVHPKTVRRLLQDGRIPGAFRFSTRGDWRIPIGALPLVERPACCCGRCPAATGAPA